METSNIWSGITIDMKKVPAIFSALLLLMLLGFAPGKSGMFTPRARGIDPVTMAVLAPIALKGARQASPYVISGMQRAGRQLLVIGGDVANLLRLPLGVVQATLGAPFGFLGDGIKNIGTGLLSPLELVLDVLNLPLAAAGLTGY